MHSAIAVHKKNTNTELICTLTDSHKLSTTGNVHLLKLSQRNARLFVRFFKTSKYLSSGSHALHFLCVLRTYISASMALVLLSFIDLFPFTEVLQSSYSAAIEMGKKTSIMPVVCIFPWYRLIRQNQRVKKKCLELNISKWPHQWKAGSFGL